VDKASFIHFVRPLQPAVDPADYLVLGSWAIAPNTSVEMLGDTLDSNIRDGQACVERGGTNEGRLHDVMHDPGRQACADASTL
jgi:hypothetical protein